MEKNKIYIPINIQTETMIFQGYGMSELFKTLAFTAITRCYMDNTIHYKTQARYS